MKDKIKILIANDNEKYTNELTNQITKDENIEVIAVAQTSDDAFSSILRYQPDIALMDVILSDSSGLEVIENVDKCKLAHKTKFIIVTSITQNNIVNKAKEIGVEDYFVKPFEITKLIDKIKSAVNFVEEPVLMGSVFMQQNVDFVQIEDKSDDKNIEIIVSNLLHEIGASSNLTGYEYVKDGIMMSVKDKSLVKSITKRLYPEIADTYKTSSTRVERSIRHCIELSWERGDINILNRYFGNRRNRNKRPTNSEFIAVLSEKIRLERIMAENKLINV